MSIYITIALVSFFQNFIFTLNSRSRASGHAEKHLFTGFLSNGVWFIVTFILILPEISEAISSGAEWVKWVLFLDYAFFSALGGYIMMKINLGHWGNVPFLTEKGKSRVGAR